MADRAREHRIEEREYSETEIAVHWREEQYVPPPSAFTEKANADDPEILKRFREEGLLQCFEEYAELLSRDRRWDTVLDDSNPPFSKWWVGGRPNACVSCVDRRLALRADDTALIWVPELEDQETQEITYRELYEIPAGSDKAGNISIREPWPGRMLTVWHQDKRFIDTYYAKYNHNKRSKDWRDWPFLCGAGAVQAADGYFRILGRIDDVINVAGHRLGTKELESAAIEVEGVAEAAAAPVVDELRGKVVEIYVALKPGSRALTSRRGSRRRSSRTSARSHARRRVGAGRHAQDALGQDHAARDRRDLQPRRRRRRHHTGQPRDRRRDLRAGAMRKTCSRGDARRSVGEAAGGNREL